MKRWNMSRYGCVLSAVAALGFGLALPAHADDGLWMPPDYGFQLSISTPNGIQQHSGTPAVVTGKITMIGPHNICDGDHHGNHGDDHGDHYPKGDSDDNLLAIFQKTGLVLHATFPNATNEVTPQVVFTSTNCNEIDFTYTSPNLVATDLNDFGLEVVHIPEQVLDLQRIQAKLDLRVKILQAFIAKNSPTVLASPSPEPSQVEPTDGDADQDLKAATRQLQDIEARLSAISARITALLQSQSGILAQEVFPLQVDNIVAGESLYSVVSNHFKLTLQYPLGTAIDGESTKVIASVTRLGHTDDDDQNDDQSQWILNLDWLGASVQKLGPVAIPVGQTMTITQPTGKLEPEAVNIASLTLNAADADDDGHDGDQGGHEDQGHHPLFGSLALVEPTADDQIPPTWQAQSTPTRVCLNAMQPINMVAVDPFGLVDPTSFVASLTGIQTNGTPVNENLTSELTIATPDQGQTYTASANLNPIPEGLYTFNMGSSDLAGNATTPNPYTVQFRVDRTPPMVTLGPLAQIYTNSPYTNIAQLQFAASTLDSFDLCQLTTTATDNGNVIGTSNTGAINVSAHLADGPHEIEVSAVNSSDGLTSAVQSFQMIVDTVPPVLSNMVPAANAVILATLNINVSGQANEPLLYAKVNGQPLTLSSDKKSFSGVVTAVSQGPLTLHYEVADLATNVTKLDVPVQIIFSALNKNLISISPDSNGKNLDVIGAVGAAIPGETINVSTSLLNNYTVTANGDGSFELTLPPFTQVSVTATDSTYNLSSNDSLSYGSAGGTHLSGMVEDTEGNPLAGVTVSIADSSIPAVQTDATGTFLFSEPVTGDQTLIINGSTAQNQPGTTPRTFASLDYPVSIGLVQSNVLQRPIYLQATPNDGSVAKVDASAGGTVTSPDAPGVTLDIPAGATQFPGGAPSSPIYMAKIPAKYSTIKPFDFAMPQNVVALEPSGTTFSQPVQLTLPNDNNLPAGVQVVIMSMDSRSGFWGIDGVGTVSSDGSSIVTKPGQGITHFSMVYATPIGPTVRQIGAQDQPGADTFNGALTTAIKMPTYRLLGKDVGPALLYRSSWARPSTLVTNLFDLSSKEIDLNSDTSGNRNLSIQSCFGPFCSSQDITVYWESSQRGKAWYQPRLITAQFFTDAIASPVMNFGGGSQLLPERSVVSFGTDLLDPTTNDYLASGVYPYYSKYNLYLDQLVVGTRTVTTWSSVSSAPQVSVYSLNNQTQIAQAFPQDQGGPIFVQNEINSSAGRGWRIAGVQKIANPSGSRVMVEEPDGSMSSFAVGNSMTTLLNDVNNPSSLDNGVGFSWPYAYVTDSSGRSIRKVNLTNGSESPAGSALSLSGSAIWFQLGTIYSDAGFTGEYAYRTSSASFTQQGHAGQMLPLQNGSVYGVDSQLGAVFQSSGGNSSALAGSVVSVPTYGAYLTSGIDVWPYSPQVSDVGIGPVTDQPGYPNSIYPLKCSSLPSGQSCLPLGPTWYAIENAVSNFCGLPAVQCGRTSLMTNEQPFPYGLTLTAPPLTSSGQIAASGFNGDGPMTSELNHPMGIAAGPTPNTIVVADTGNNRVRLIDLNAQTMTTVAGNGQTYDNGDGGPATQASIFHPRGVAYDALGNLYISSENGFVRKVDPTGMISTFAGSTSGVLADSVAAKNALLSTPYGLVVDNDNGYLYVADTGHHRVIRIDFQTQNAVTVAGNGGPSDSIDGQAALVGGLTSPTFVGLDNNDNLLIVDSGNNKIKRVTFQAGSGGSASYQLTSSPNPGVRQNPDGSWVMGLIKNSDGTWTRNYRNGDLAYFDVNGNETLYQDRVGRKTQYVYSGNNLIQMIDPTGRTTNYSYSGSNLMNITDPAGRMTQFSYGANNTLTRVMFPDGTSRSYTYSADGLMTSETNQNGSTNAYTYNAYHRLASVQTDSHAPVMVNDSASETAINNYTGDQVASAVAYGTDPDEVNDSISDPLQNKTTFAKDYRGYVETIVDPAGAKTEIDRDNLGNPLTITRPDNTQETMSYDPIYSDLLSQTDTATGITVSQVYDAYGNMLSQTNGRGKTATTTYTPTGLVATKTDANGNSSTYGYNSLGQVTSTTNALGKSTVAVYDGFGNVVSITDAAGRKTTMTVDQAGNVLTTTDPSNRTYEYQYDSFNRLTSATTPKGETTLYSYSPTGKLIQIKDAQGNIATLKYDDLDREIQKTDALGFSTLDSYDEDGNLIQETDPNGNVKKYSYNSQGLLTEKQLPDNTVLMSYDPSKRLLSAANNQSDVVFTYDDAGRLTAATSSGAGQLSSLPKVTLNFGWDDNNNRVSMSDPTGTTSYTFDAADRLTAITNPQGETFNFAFDAANRLTSIARPGSQTEVSWDDSNLVSSIIHSNGTPISQFLYTRDQAGNVTGVQTTTSNRTLAYDADTQLISATNPEAPQNAMKNESYSYDSIANRTQDEGGNYSYGPHSQRLVQDYRYTYIYDKNGNLSSKQEIADGVGADGFIGEVTNYFYSSENQLIGIKVYPSGNSSTPAKEISYSYDALGRRIQKVVTDNGYPSDPTKTFTRDYVYDGQDILLEYSGDGALLARYTHSTLGPDDVLAVNVTSDGSSAVIAQNPGNYFYLKDAQGSVTDITDNSGNRLQHYVYSAYGQLLQIQNGAGTDITLNPIIRTTYTFTGRELDPESGLYYFRARLYDPNTGRFLQKDPSPGKLSVPTSVVNSYAYTANNPANLTDPTGASFFSILTDILVIAAAAAAAYFLAPIAVGLVLGNAAAGTAIGAIGGFAIGAVAGAAVGALAGGLVGGAMTALGGGSFSEGFKAGAVQGAITGATVGAVRGAVAGYNGVQAATSTHVVSAGHGNLLAANDTDINIEQIPDYEDGETGSAIGKELYYLYNDFYPPVYGPPAPVYGPPAPLPTPSPSP